MKLHRNAALSWSGRRRLAVRVVVERWTVAAAARAAGVSVRCARKWVARYRDEGEQGLCDRSSAPRRVRTAHRQIGWRRSWRCGGCGSRRPRSRRCWRCRFRPCQLCSRGRGWDGWDGSGLSSRPLRAAGPASSSTSTSRSSAGFRAGPAGGYAAAPSITTAPSPIATARSAELSAGSTFTLRSTTIRGSRTRKY